MVAGGGIPSPSSPYIFSLNDEYYDYNETARRILWSPQTMPDGTPAIEPMWRAMPRYDWILEKHLANGDDNFTYPIDQPLRHLRPQRQHRAHHHQRRSHRRVQLPDRHHQTGRAGGRHLGIRPAPVQPRSR